MQNKRFAAAVIALAVAIAGSGSGCGNQTADITGSWWSDDGGTTVIFNKDGTYSIDIETKEYTGNGSYSLKNNTITMIDQKNGTQTYTIEKKNGKVELDGKSNNFYGSHDDAVSMRTIKVAEASSAAQVQALQKLDKMATTIKDKIIGSWLNAENNQAYTFNKDGTYSCNNVSGKYSIQKYQDMSAYEKANEEQPTAEDSCIINLDNHSKPIFMFRDDESSKAIYNGFNMDKTDFIRIKSTNLVFSQLPQEIREGKWTGGMSSDFSSVFTFVSKPESDNSTDYKIKNNKITITRNYKDTFSGKVTKAAATFNMYIYQDVHGTYIMNLRSDNSSAQEKTIIQDYAQTFKQDSKS